jgi:replicative DNA helicase
MDDERRQWERWLLLQILLDDPTLAFRFLKVEAFQDYRHALIFLASKKIMQQGKRVTLSAIADSLREQELLERIGGDNFLCEFSAAIVAEHGWL